MHMHMNVNMYNEWCPRFQELKDFKTINMSTHKPQHKSNILTLKWVLK